MKIKITFKFRRDEAKIHLSISSTNGSKLEKDLTDHEARCAYESIQEILGKRDDVEFEVTDYPLCTTCVCEKVGADVVNCWKMTLQPFCQAGKR